MVIQHTLKRLEDAFGENTLRAYRAGLNVFDYWCKNQQLPPPRAYYQCRGYWLCRLDGPSPHDGYSDCRKQASLRSGAIFHASILLLRQWFQALFLIS
jgi:hypothetical protein